MFDCRCDYHVPNNQLLYEINGIWSCGITSDKLCFVDYREPFDTAKKYVPKLNCSCTTYFQEDIMAEARQVEADAATYLDQISRYFITRGKIISKVAKYPHVVSVHVNRCKYFVSGSSPGEVSRGEKMYGFLLAGGLSANS